MMQEERNYLELKIPICQNAEWLSNLCDAMAKEGIYVKWQNDWYHITVMFAYDNKHIKELQSAFDKMLDNHEVPVMVLDELGVFTTRGGHQHVVYLTSSKASMEVTSLIECLRGEAKSIGANIDPDFRLHISLGRIDAHAYSIEQVQTIIEKIKVPDFAIDISEAEYRYFRGHTIQRWQMK